MRIFLVGYMGSGKSKTAAALSKVLKYSFVDTDQLVEEKTGSTIASLFGKEGQEYFREIEREVLRNTCERENIVISTGGGAPAYHDNMNWMNANGITVYLQANPGLLFHRLASSKKGRPLIEDLDDVTLMEQITGHLAVRIPVYQQAKITVEAADLDVKELAEKIRSFKD